MILMSRIKTSCKYDLKTIGELKIIRRFYVVFGPTVAGSAGGRAFTIAPRCVRPDLFFPPLFAPGFYR